MSIVSYTGLPRSGKSYNAVENIILPAAKSGRLIYTNIPIKEKLKEDYPKLNLVNFTNDEPKDNEQFWSDIPGGAVILIDETWRYWKAGLKANNMSDSMQEFFTMHGHKVGENGMTQEIVFLTQDNKQIAAFVRDLIEETFICQKLNAIGMKKSFKIDIHQFGVTGRPPQKNRIRHLTGTYKKAVYQYYVSHTLGDGDQVGQESKMDDRGNIFKSKFFMLVIPACILSLFFVVPLVVDSFKGMTGGNFSEKKEKTKTVKVDNKQIILTQRDNVKQSTFKPQTYSLPPAVIEQMKPTEISLSKKWRISGVLRSTQMNTVVLSSKNGNRSLPLDKYCEQFEGSNDWKCIVDNEKITTYSGMGSYRLSRSISVGATSHIKSSL